MIEFTKGDILQANAQALVKPVDEGQQSDPSDPANDRSSQHTAEAKAIGVRDSSCTK